MIKRGPLSATGLRLILICSLFVIALLAGIGISFADSKLQNVAIDVSHTVVDANASQNNLQTLQKIQQELVTDKDVVARAGSIVADSQSYQYQDQILTDLNDYASQAGISITNLDFSAATQTSTSATTTTPTPAAPALTPSGVKSTSVSVTIKNPVDYDSLLRFIKSIEQNLTKMQISKISLSRDPASGGVTSEAFTIEVYIR